MTTFLSLVMMDAYLLSSKPSAFRHSTTTNRSSSVAGQKAATIVCNVQAKGHGILCVCMFGVGIGNGKYWGGGKFVRYLSEIVSSRFLSYLFKIVWHVASYLV